MKLKSFCWILLGLAACTTPPQENTNAIRFTILHVNDVYEIAPLEGGKVAGMARLETLQKELQEENAQTFTILAGDFLSPSLLGMLDYQGEKIAGRQMVEVMNAVGFDYVTFGNHELDLKRDQLQARINESEFEWIATNVWEVSEGDTAAFTKNGQPLAEEALVKVGNAQGDSVTVGWLGLCLPFNKQPFVYYTDWQQEAATHVAAWGEGVAVPLAITHLERKQDSALLAATPELALGLGGHDHDNMRVEVGDRYFAKADANARTAYVHRFTVDPATGRFRVNSELVALDESIALDPAVSEVVEKWTVIANQAMEEMGFDPNRVVATTTEPLDGRSATIRYRPTNLGEITAKAMWWADSTTDLAVFNSGSVRVDDQLQGNITEYDILRTYPFGGPVVRVAMKGADLEKLLTIGLETNVGLGGYLQTYGVSKADGGYQINGAALDLSRTYAVMMPEFLAKGREANLEFLAELPPYQSPETFGEVKNDLRNLMVAYFLSGEWE